MIQQNILIGIKLSPLDCLALNRLQHQFHLGFRIR
ncbi:hypothetical protein REG_1579, partial [Candidatus Regiella insecticola LSR1]